MRGSMDTPFSDRLTGCLGAHEKKSSTNISAALKNKDLDFIEYLWDR